MKRPFRYFRGEFARGVYLYALAVCPNLAVQDVVDELVYQTLFQWKLEDEVTAHEMPIRDADIYNIGKIAGLFPFRTQGLTSAGSTYFTETHPVNGKERSERALMDMEREVFKFVRTEHDEYPDDVVAEASPDFRMGHVPAGTEPVGYVPYGVNLFTESGEIIWEHVLPEPPTDGTPYTTFYGERFLVHEEFFNKITLLPVEVYKLLLECVQRVRYNGPSVGRFMEITRILGDGYITGIEIVPAGSYYRVYWQTDESVEITNRDRRVAAWKGVCSQKFKLFVLERRSE
jgi:hypothetical protein